MHFNPADIQTIGVGLAAFLAALTTIFIFFSARDERLGRAMLLLIASATVWSWFGFLYEIVPSIALAREMRVISVIGIVWMSMTEINFALVYLEERIKIGWKGRIAQFFGVGVGTLLTILLIGDLFGGRLIVGDLTLPPDQVLAPDAGPLLAIVIAFYAFAIAISGVLLAMRARAGINKSDRRQAEIIFASIVLALAFGGTRFTPWYGVEYPPFLFLAAGAAPLFIFAAFYSIKRYNLLNVEIAVAQLLIFALWAFTFFRILLDPTARILSLDGVFFIAVLVLGIFLLRSIATEIRSQKELAQLTIERVKSEFVMIATHQLRTPLAAIRGTFDLLSSKDHESLSSDQRELIRRGSGATNSMLLIVNDLLDVARLSGGTSHLVIEPGDVRDAVRAGGVLFEEAAKSKNIRLTFDIPELPLTTIFDHGKLALAIENLIDNAIKYTPSGGSVSVRAVRVGDKILIKVIDTGTGISHDERAQLFDKFFRGKSAMHMSPDGFGLGLFIAKNIIDGHGGAITVTSTEGNGTDATIVLPVS